MENYLDITLYILLEKLDQNNNLNTASRLFMPQAAVSLEGLLRFEQFSF